MPSKTKEKEEEGDTLLKLIMVKLALKSTMKVVPHTFTNVKNFLLYCTKDTTIRASSNDAANKTKTTLEKLEDLHDSIALKMNVIIMKAFNLYQQMLSPTLRVKWDVTVNKICFFAGWLDDLGVKSTVKHGQALDTLKQCKCAHLLTVCNKVATKRWYMYCTITIKKPQRLAIKSIVEQFR